ncbi:MAG: ATP-binding protein, partial [candidate division KSB1 bacterium]|nr:ATP-binding protein [candidate division KSB1 bacterium]
MTLSLRKKIIFLNLTLLILATVSASFFISYQLQKYYQAREFDRLRSQAETFHYLLSQDFWRRYDRAENYRMLTGMANSANLRLTLIDSAGVVLFDSRVHMDSLAFVENHLKRPEIQMAIQQGIGHHERVSATVNLPFFYVAIRRHPDLPLSPPFQRAAFIRTAMDLVAVHTALREIRHRIFLGSGIAILLISAIAYFASRRLANPISRLAQVAQEVKEGHLDAKFHPITNDEIGELAKLLNQMLVKLRHDLKEMRKLQTMRSQFLGNVSHELRTPIFALQGYLETLLHQNIDDPQQRRHFLEKAYNVSVRLDNLLGDLIDISRIESGEMKMSFRYFDVHQWLEKLCQEWQNKAVERGVSLHFSPDPQASGKVTVLGDTERLNQVMINLINNAIKYNVPNGRVEVGYRLTADRVTIFVRDTGRGIPKEHLPRIFERFYRVDKQRSRDIGGTGLGLAIVKHIIEAHGSRVQVHSKVNLGSEF